MIVDYLEKRIEGYWAVVLADTEDEHGNPENPMFFLISADYEEQVALNKNNENSARVLMDSRNLKIELRKLLKEHIVSKQLDFDTLINYALSYGGIHINPETGGWRAF